MKPRFFKRMTIATCLLWAFLVMALVPLSVVTYLTYTASEQALRAEVTNNLRVIADSKANQIETYARERQRNVTALARMPSIVNAFEPLDQAFVAHGIGAPEYTAVEAELRPFLILQRGFTPAGWLVRCGACDVKDTPHDFSGGGSSECQAPTACQTRGGAGQSPTPSPPGVTSPLGLFFNRRLMRTTKKCARMINVI